MAKSPSAYAKKMSMLSRRIFNQLPPSYLTTRNEKVVKRFQLIPFAENGYRANYYPPHPMFHSLTQLLRAHGLYRDEHQDFMDEFKRLAILRGKGPPTPGEGKRAKIRKQGK